MYVLDASVILKWFLQEEDSEKAIALKDAHSRGESFLIIPDLAIYEIANSLRYKPEFSSAEINRCCHALFDLDIDIVAPLPDLINPTTDLARQKEITFYDASYIALAVILGLQFITADEKLYNKTKDITSVHLLNKISI